MASALRSALFAGSSALARAVGLTGTKPVRPTVSYVVALKAGDLIGIYASNDLADDLKSIQREVPSAKVGYVLAVDVDPKMVASLAEGNLVEWSVGGGWFRTSLEEAEAAIDAAVRAYTGITPFHTTSDAVIATQRKR